MMIAHKQVTSKARTTILNRVSRKFKRRGKGIGTKKRDDIFPFLCFMPRCINKILWQSEVTDSDGLKCRAEALHFESQKKKPYIHFLCTGKNAMQRQPFSSPRDSAATQPQSSRSRAEQRSARHVHGRHRRRRRAGLPLLVLLLRRHLTLFARPARPRAPPPPPAAPVHRHAAGRREQGEDA